MTGAPYLPGFGRCGIPRLSTGHSLLQRVLMLMVICTLHTQEPRFVEPHICQNRADVGHPSFVTDQAVRNAGLLRQAEREMNAGHPFVLKTDAASKCDGCPRSRV